jgi:hypothetical protein
MLTPTVREPIPSAVSTEPIVGTLGIESGRARGMRLIPAGFYANASGEALQGGNKFSHSSLRVKPKLRMRGEGPRA